MARTEKHNGRTGNRRGAMQKVRNEKGEMNQKLTFPGVLGKGMTSLIFARPVTN
jgi:hypothetical protein